MAKSRSPHAKSIEKRKSSEYARRAERLSASREMHVHAVHAHAVAMLPAQDARGARKKSILEEVAAAGTGAAGANG